MKNFRVNYKNRYFLCFQENETKAKENFKKFKHLFFGTHDDYDEMKPGDDVPYTSPGKIIQNEKAIQLKELKIEIDYVIVNQDSKSQNNTSIEINLKNPDNLPIVTGNKRIFVCKPIEITAQKPAESSTIEE